MTPIVIENPSIGTVTWQLPDWLEAEIGRVERTNPSASEEVVAGLERWMYQFFLLLTIAYLHPSAGAILLPLWKRQMDDLGQIARMIIIGS